MASDRLRRPLVLGAPVERDLGLPVGADGGGAGDPAAGLRAEAFPELTFPPRPATVVTQSASEQDLDGREAAAPHAPQPHAALSLPLGSAVRLLAGLPASLPSSSRVCLRVTEVAPWLVPPGTLALAPLLPSLADSERAGDPHPPCGCWGVGGGG